MLLKRHSAETIRKGVIGAFDKFDDDATAACPPLNVGEVIEFSQPRFKAGSLQSRSLLDEDRHSGANHLIPATKKGSVCILWKLVSGG